MQEREWVLMVEIPCRAPKPEDAIAWFRAECEAGRRVPPGRGVIRAVRDGRPPATVALIPAPEPGAPSPGMSGAAMLSYLLGLAEAHRRILSHVEQIIPHDDDCAPHLREAVSILDARVRRLRRLLGET